jgi:oligopeptide transport system substrate-binding protein
MVLVRNPRYTGRSSGNVQQVELHALDQSVALGEYGAGNLDVLDLQFLAAPLVDSARQRHGGEYLSVPWLMTLFAAFDVSQPPFDDSRVRRALALATDRDALAEVDLRGYVFPATGGFLPPGLPGHTPGIALPCDPQEARQLLAEAGYPEGRGFPMIEALTPPEFEPVSRHLEARWRETLGLETTWQKVDIEEFFERMRRGQPIPLALLRWRADYPDPASFLSTLPLQRMTKWRNKAYADLVERARQVLDQEGRMGLYKRADKILIEETSILPLYYGRWQMLVKPWVRRYPTSPINCWFWKDVIIEPH